MVRDRMNLCFNLFKFRWPERFYASARTGEADTRWIDGLRGLSACFVIWYLLIFIFGLLLANQYSNHLTLTLAPEILFPVSKEARLNSLWQWPFIQAITTGFPWVAFFLVLSAWVNSIKPLRLLRQGQYEEAIISLSSSCFRRVPRLVLPITVATVLSWILAQFGAYQMGYNNTNHWLVSTSPQPFSDVGDAIWSLWYAFYATWSEADNYYDKNLWCMGWFIRSSMLLYLYLLATCRMKQSIRGILTGGMLFWAWRTNDDLVGIPTYIGILISMLGANPRFREISSSRSISKRFFVFFLFTIGLFFLSFPSYDWDFAPWFNFITKGLRFLFPKNANLYNQCIYLGIVLILSSAIISPTIQHTLRYPALLWLGELSLPIYLIHGPLLRSLFLWIAYAFEYPEYSETTDQSGNVVKTLKPLGRPSNNRVAIAMPIYLLAVLFLANVWNRTIEPLCASFSKFLEEVCIGRKEIFVSFRDANEKTEEEEMIPV